MSMKNLVNTLNSLGATLDYIGPHYQEDSLIIIESLLRASKETCCLQDEDGMTPLIRATINSYIPSIHAILKYCPESIEICDPNGKNILHHIKLPTLPEAMRFLSIPGMSMLMDRQDVDGNTPLHVAIVNGDYNMVKAMLEYSANFVIANKLGISPAYLIQSDPSLILDKMKDQIRIRRRGSITENEFKRRELFEEVHKKNWDGLISKLIEANSNDEQFLARRPYGSNLIHAAMVCCETDNAATYDGYNNDANKYSSTQEEFIVETLKKFPELICQTNLKGETPLHLAMNRKILKPGGMAFNEMFELMKLIGMQPGRFPLPPWEQKDDNGETVLHLAVKYKRYKFAESLIKIDSKVVKAVNNDKKNSLHILCEYGTDNALLNEDDEKMAYAMVDFLLEIDVMIVGGYDAGGFTPFLRAVQNGAFKIATNLLIYFPHLMEQRDLRHDRVAFHLIKLKHDDIEHKKFCELPHMKNIFGHQDSEGNTPLHLAIQDQRFGTAQILMNHFGYDITPYRKRNKEGETVLDVLTKAQNFPRWFQDFLSSTNSNLPIGPKDTGNSIYGVRFADMKEYMGPLGVVAALLTTITFTAAFTVPGGYDENNGTPTLARTIAFQVFMFTDVVGMCSSMMALFCLLWFLNSGRIEDEGSQLVDLSIGLLQLSFYATLLAFISGVYVTTYPDAHWLAFYTCVLCSVVLLLMRKRSILDLVVPSFNFIYINALKPLSDFVTACTRFVLPCSKPKTT